MYIMKTMFEKSAILSLAISAALLSGCAGSATQTNRSLDSVHQPVVNQTHFVMDLTTSGGALPVSEQQRLSDWLEAMDVGYGDRVAIDDPAPYGNKDAHEAVAQLVSGHGMMMARAAPITAGTVAPGSLRIVISRSQAAVPGCPDWSSKSVTDFTSATGSNYGCAVNSSLAAMVADPQDLVKGANGALSDPVSAAKAIKAYRDAEPTGKKGLKVNNTQEGGKN